MPGRAALLLVVLAARGGLAAPAGAGGGTVSLRLRVRPAHRGGVRVRVTARLAGGVTAGGSITRRVR